MEKFSYNPRKDKRISRLKQRELIEEVKEKLRKERQAQVEIEETNERIAFTESERYIVTEFSLIIVHLLC